MRGLSYPVESPGLDAGLQNQHAINPQSRTRVFLEPGIQRYSGQVGAPAYLVAHLQPMTGSLCRYSARWEECPATNPLQIAARLFQHQQCLQKQFTPPAGLSLDRPLDSDTWDDMSSASAARGSFAVYLAGAPYCRGHRIRVQQSGIQHLDMRTPSFVTSMVLPERRSASSGQRCWTLTRHLLHSTSTRVPTSATDQETLRLGCLTGTAS